MNREWKIRNIMTNLYALVLFTSAGLYSWAIRGSSGYGGSMGCLFAGILWAIFWYWLSQDTPPNIKRPYSTAWVLPAIFLGIGLSGMQGWMQWANWIQGNYYLDWDTQLIQPISPWYGVLWWFIVGIHWGGMGGVLLVWTSPQRLMGRKDWLIRILFGAGGLGLAYLLFIFFPQVFLPLYAELDNYNLELYPNIIRVIHDNRQAIMWLGLYLGFLIYEITQKNWHGVKLILITGVGTGILWPLFQRFFWYFVPEMIFPTISFNWWRVWESAAGGAIGLVYGIAFIMLNKSLPPAEKTIESEISNGLQKKSGNFKRIEHMVAYTTIWSGILLGLKNGLEGMDNIYGFTEVNWNLVILPLIAIGVAGILFLYKYHPKLKKGFYSPQEIPFFTTILILAYLLHRLSIFFSTGPLTNPIELLFVFYYLVLTALDITLISVRLRFLRIMNS